jgi:enoyl-CoA hydratase/carnithine racemase
MEFDQIKYELKEQVLTITLNRAEKLNAFTTGMKNELIKAFDQADQDDEVRVVIVTGAGKAFCAGQDLRGGVDTFAYKTQPIEEHRDIGGLLTLRIFEMKKPVIAAINGPAVGIGITMTLPMDIRIASENSKIGFVFTRRGLVPEACSGWFLPRLVGMSRAMEWVISGRVFSAQEALEGGLVSRVVPPEQLLPKAQELAREIADNTSAVSVALSRQILWRMLGADHPMEAHKIDSRCVYYMGKSLDCYEGVSSFREKRPPLFKMKPSQDMPDFYPWWKDRHFQ